jgi:hypothetical protein
MIREYQTRPRDSKPLWAPMTGMRQDKAMPAPVSRKPTPRVTTPAGWWLALMPIWFVVLAIFAGLITPASWMTVLIYAITLIVMIVLALADREALLASGHPKPVRLGWLFLGPLAYLIVRAINVYRTTRKGWSLPVVLVGSVIVVIGFETILLAAAHQLR